jgi:hypothetical protein
VSFVDLPGNVEHGPVGLETLDLRVGRVDGEDLSRIAVGEDVREDDGAEFPGGGRGADDGDGFRPQEGVEASQAISGYCRRLQKYLAKTPPELFQAALEDFADTLKAKFAVSGSGEPEDQLRAPLEALFEAYSRIINREILLTGEPHLGDRVGKPDFAAHHQKQTIGYVEAKAPGKGADPAFYKGHDLEQWHRFQIVPNLFYRDGNEWALYRNGEGEGQIVRFRGDARGKGSAAVNSAIASSLFQLFAAFGSWAPIVPQKPKDLAEFLAPYCRLIRGEVEEALGNARSPLAFLL